MENSRDLAWRLLACVLIVGLCFGCQEPQTASGGGTENGVESPSPDAGAREEDPPPADAPPDLGEMVLVPEGWFLMGSNDGKPFERPAHKVYLDAYYIDLYEVTNYEFRKYVRATGASPPPHWKDGTYAPGRGLNPVTNITKEEAAAYAAWVGKRLPTEAEWEKACRGPNGNQYAFGNPFDKTLTNTADTYLCDTVPVDRHPEGLSFYGCFNLTGNVWEWVSDWFSTTYYKDKQRNPKGPPSGTLHVSKGGSWTTDAQSCRAAYRCRSLPGGRWGYCGFRCARSERTKAEIQPPGEEKMILIPAGWFLMGADEFPLSAPKRRVYLDAFKVDRVPVTNREYSDFCKATGHPVPEHWHMGYFPDGLDEHPVTNVSMDDARAFAKWAGKRLLTEAEWEKAARGTDGRMYPWGEKYDAKKANALGSKIGHTVKVGTYPEGKSPYGVLGMCGNIWEWVEGYFTKKGYAGWPDRNPKGPAEGTHHVLRGGTWSTFPINCRTYSRCMGLPGCKWGYSGFRCAKDVK
ncbi:MAG: formylglycine-generating enzyme family protein [Planctomycetota bacterium]|jgi:formylglycine-generating enzyme required for sulfatase activity